MGSSLLALILSDEDVLEFAYEPLWESLSEPLVDAVRKSSSCTAETPLGNGGLRPKGLRKGGMVVRLIRECNELLLGRLMHGMGCIQ